MPTLFLGLGGAGATIVDRIAGILKDSADWDQIGEICQFFIIDTDRAMVDDCPNVPLAHKFIISGFDKGIYASMKKGNLGQEANEPDPRVVQWLHPWYNFRSSRGAGAGQIRIESRLSIYNALESTDLISRISRAISQTLHYKIPNVDTRTKEVRVFLYFSVAGGTGSGSVLTVTYLMRHLAEQFGLKANITGVAMLPTLFLDVIRNNRQQLDVLCNGYSTLKEIEHLMKLKITSDERDPTKNRRSFVYHPHASQTDITEAPFDFVYVIDTPPDLSVGQEFRDVVADGIYLQMFSPIFAKKDSDFDNYEKNQKRFAAGLYSVFYGSFGCSVLVLPDRDILRYCSLRQAEQVFKDYFVSTFRTSDNQRFPSEEEETAWEHLDERTRNRHLDMAYIRYIVAEHTYRSDTKSKVETSTAAALGSIYRMFRLTGTHKDSLGRAPALLGDDERKAMLDMVWRKIDEQEGQSETEGSSEWPTIDSELMQSAARTVVSSVLYDIQTTAVSEGAEGEDAEEDLPEEEQDQRLVYSGWRKITQEVIFGPNGLIHLLDEALRSPLAPEGPPQVVRKSNPSVVDEVIVEHAVRLKNWSEDLIVGVRRFLSDVRNTYGTTKAIKQLIHEEGKEEDVDLLTLRLYFIALREELQFLHEAAELVQQQKGLVPEVVNKAKKVLDRIKNQNFDDLGPGKMEKLRIESKVTFVEGTVSKMGGRDEHQKFLDAWNNIFISRRDEWVDTTQSYYFLEGLKGLCKTILAPIDRFLDTLRTFNRIATQKRLDIQTDVDNYLKEAGEEANRFVVDVEILQNLQGERLWDKYYDLYIAQQRRLSSEEVVRILTDAFLDEQLAQRPEDIAEAIKEHVLKLSRNKLHDVIIGQHRSGDERGKRGLLIDQALRIEAELCYVDHLETTGRFSDVKEVYSLYRDDPQSRVASVMAFRAELDRYTAAYLEVKLNKCIRTSGILANIDMNSNEVMDFACKQAIMAYDQSLYGKPEKEPDKRPDHFPSIVRKIKPEVIDNHWGSAESAKRVIFYQALLGVPLFTFHNVRQQLKEAYNRRQDERNWLNPYGGRQYPLHIDKNWEPDEPDADPVDLPWSLEPDEAVETRTQADKGSFEILHQFLTLLYQEEIAWGEEEGFFVPPGKLDNPEDREKVFLGTSLRKAVRVIQMSPPAIELIKKRVGDDLLPRKRLNELHEVFAAAVEPDVWQREGEPSKDVVETADLLEDLTKWLDAQKDEQQKRDKEPRLGRLLGPDLAGEDKGGRGGKGGGPGTGGKQRKASAGSQGGKSNPEKEAKPSGETNRLEDE